MLTLSSSLSELMNTISRFTPCDLSTEYHVASMGVKRWHCAVHDESERVSISVTRERAAFPHVRAGTSAR
jgi:hypothetical protein